MNSLKKAKLYYLAVTLF